MEATKYYMLTHHHFLEYRPQTSRWFCDLSVQLNGCMSGLSSSNLSKDDCYMCIDPNCSYAVCSKCYEHYKCESHEMPSISSPDQFSTIHPHRLTSQIGKSWTCDGRKFYYNQAHWDGENKLTFRYAKAAITALLMPECILTRFGC